MAEALELKRAMEKVKEKFGKIDVLFANAGISHCPPIEETTSEDFDGLSRKLD